VLHPGSRRRCWLAACTVAPIMHLLLLVALLVLQKATAFYNNVQVPHLRPLGAQRTALAVSPIVVDTTSHENYGSWAPPLKVCSIIAITMCSFEVARPSVRHMHNCTASIVTTALLIGHIIGDYCCSILTCVVTIIGNRSSSSSMVPGCTTAFLVGTIAVQ
jgi:hypothetical protein